MRHRVHFQISRSSFIPLTGLDGNILLEQCSRFGCCAALPRVILRSFGEKQSVDCGVRHPRAEDLLSERKSFLHRFAVMR